MENFDMTPFKIKEFEKVLLDSEPNAQYLLNLLKTSNNNSSNSKKVPLEALFINWGHQENFIYSENAITTEEIKVDPDDSIMATKGQLNLQDCNLGGILLAKEYPLDSILSYLLDDFIILNAYKAKKTIPVCFMILNRNKDFNKGVNKILKMVATSSINHQ